MKLDPGSIDYAAVVADLNRACAILQCTRQEIRQYSAGSRYRPAVPTRTAIREANRFNRRWYELDRMAFGPTIIRSDGSAYGPPAALEKLIEHAAAVGNSGIRG